MIVKRQSKVRRIEGEDYRYYADSDTFGAFPWLVDLEAHNGEGKCACPDFDCVRMVLRSRDERNQMLRLCKHQKRCLLDWGLREYASKCGANKLSGMPQRAVILWALREVRRRVREKRKANRGRVEQE